MALNEKQIEVLRDIPAIDLFEYASGNVTESSHRHVTLYESQPGIFKVIGPMLSVKNRDLQDAIDVFTKHISVSRRD